MSELPIYVTVVGDGTTNPAIPSYNFGGTVSFAYGNIVIESGDFTYKIPSEQIDNMYSYTESSIWGNEWRLFLLIFLTLGTFFFAFPFVWYWLYVEWTALEVLIDVIAWDEHHGFKSTTTFSLGRKRSDRDRALDIVREIWRERGDTRREENNRSTVVYRAN